MPRWTLTSLISLITAWLAWPGTSAGAEGFKDAIASGDITKMITEVGWHAPEMGHTFV